MYREYMEETVAERMETALYHYFTALNNAPPGHKAGLVHTVMKHFAIKYHKDFDSAISDVVCDMESGLEELEDEYVHLDIEGIEDGE